MAATITMQLDAVARDVPADPYWYCPGEPISGSGEILTDADLNARKAAVSLYWKTEGRGDKDKEVVASQDLHQGPVPGGRPLRFTFSFTAPPSPWSYSGSLLHIHWFVEVKIDIPFGRDFVETRRIIIAPPARVIPAAPPVEDSPPHEEFPDQE